MLTIDVAFLLQQKPGNEGDEKDGDLAARASSPAQPAKEEQIYDKGNDNRSLASHRLVAHTSGGR